MKDVIYTEDGKVLHKVDSNKEEQKSLNDIVNEVNNKKVNKHIDKNKDIFDREPMRLCATGCTAASVGLSTFLAIGGVSPVFGVLINMLGFYFTMVAKGSRQSKYCVALAFINIISATILLVYKLKSVGAFDWLQYNMR